MNVEFSRYVSNFKESVAELILTDQTVCAQLIEAKLPEEINNVWQKFQKGHVDHYFFIQMVSMIQTKANPIAASRIKVLSHRPSMHVMKKLSCDKEHNKKAKEGFSLKVTSELLSRDYASKEQFIRIHALSEKVTPEYTDKSYFEAWEVFLKRYIDGPFLVQLIKKLEKAAEIKKSLEVD
jgi:hypothetical protein